MTLPNFPEGFTAEWVDGVMKQQGLLPEASRIANVERAQVGDGVGMMSELSRLNLSIEGEAGACPASVVVKYPSQNATNREVAMAYNLYEREVRYFAELDPLTSAYSPKPYWTALDGDNFVIVMEDMAAYRVGDQTVGADLGDTEVAVDELAKLHAAFWDRTGDLAWVPHIANSYHADNMASLCEIGWPNMCQIFADFIDPGIAARGDDFRADLRRLQAAMDTSPVTLTHGDFRMENLFFASAPGQRAVAICDWQGPLQAKGIVDVALMLGQSTRTEVRRQAERDLIARYVRGLAEHGIEHYTADECWQDYEMALLYNWVYVAVVAGTLDVHNERAFAWMSQMVARQSAASLDLDVFRRLS